MFCPRQVRLLKVSIWAIYLQSYVKVCNLEVQNSSVYLLLGHFRSGGEDDTLPTLESISCLTESGPLSGIIGADEVV
jgi:hypothetical protein